MLMLPLILSLMVTPAPNRPVPQLAPPPACSDTSQFSRTRVVNLLRAARTVNAPGRLRELAAVDSTHLRVVTGDDKATVCRTLRQLATEHRNPDRITGRPWHVGIMEADGYYFVLVSRDRPVARRRGADSSVPIVLGETGGSVLAYDRDLKLVTGANM